MSTDETQCWFDDTRCRDVRVDSSKTSLFWILQIVGILGKWPVDVGNCRAYINFDRECYLPIKGDSNVVHDHVDFIGVIIFDYLSKRSVALPPSSKSRPKGVL
jgi:hypothetical protein